MNFKSMETLFSVCVFFVTNQKKAISQIRCLYRDFVFKVVLINPEISQYMNTQSVLQSTIKGTKTKFA